MPTLPLGRPRVGSNASSTPSPKSSGQNSAPPAGPAAPRPARRRERDPTKPKYSRTRNGCDECKKHRVKCDERRPICERCQRNNRVCEYNPPKTIIFEPRRPSAPSTVGSSPSNTIRDGQDGAARSSSNASTPTDAVASPLPTSLSRTNETRRASDAFQYYVEHVSVVNNPPGEKVPYYKATQQVAMLEGAYMSLVSAHAALDKAFWFEDDNSAQVFFYEAMGAGMRSLRSLVARNAIASTEMTVMCCGVLSHLQLMLTGQSEAGLPHVSHALEVATKWEEEPVWPIESLEMRTTLCQGLLIGFATCRSIYKYTSKQPDNFWRVGRQPRFIAQFENWRIPVVFRHMRSAAEELSEIIIYWIIPLTRRKKPSWIGFVSPKDCLRILRDWEIPFQDSVRAAGSIARVELKEEGVAREMLRAHGIIARIAVEAEQDGWTEAFMKDQRTKFEEVLRLMAPLVNFEQGLFAGDKLKVYDSASFIFPLFFTATCAVDHGLQERALDLLRKLDTREGAWTSRLAAKIASIVVHAQRTTPPQRGRRTLWQALEVIVHFRADSKVIMVVILEDLKNTQNIQRPAVELLGEDLENVRDTGVKWPLRAVVRSWGFYQSNMLHTPLFQSASYIRNKLLHI